MSNQASNEITTNRHPVDRLAEVRAEIARLKDQETALRDAVLEMPSGDLVGDEFIATVKNASQSRLDTKAVEAKFGSLDAFRKKVQITTVRLVKRAEPEPEE
ncbi:MAG: hypothetical protein AAFR28_17610 [Pseudomonadota bacterium]